MCMDRTSLGVTWETFIVIMCSSRSSINKLFNSSSSHGLDFTASNERNCVCVSVWSCSGANAEEWSCMAFQDLRQAPRVRTGKKFHCTKIHICGMLQITLRNV